MPENILIAIAWPYANAEIHVGNITGSHLPGDIVARYHRLKGDNVLMVSGTDSHGTPVTLAADKEGKPVEEVYKKYHNGFIDLFQQMGITYDLFTTTHTENHFKVSQSIFLALKENGFLYTQKSMQWYSPSAQKFLPDRYVEGTCYICGYRRRPLGPVRQVRQCARTGKTDQSAQSKIGRLHARTARDRAFLPGPLQAGAGCDRISCASAPAICARPSWANRCARSKPKD